MLIKEEAVREGSTPFVPAEAGRFTDDIKNNIPKSAVTSLTRDSAPYIVTANTLEPRKKRKERKHFLH